MDIFYDTSFYIVSFASAQLSSQKGNCICYTCLMQGIFLVHVCTNVLLTLC
jgi:hypothetical protein